MTTEAIGSTSHVSDPRKTHKVEDDTAKIGQFGTLTQVAYMGPSIGHALGHPSGSQPTTSGIMA